jgi:hypothetical protein
LTSAHYQLQLESETPNLSLTYVCRRLYHETALLQFRYIDFHCVDIWVCAILLLRFTNAQRAALENLTIEVVLGKRYPIQEFLEYADGKGILLSRLYPNLRRVNVVNRLTKVSLLRDATRDNRERLEKWLRRGSNEDLKVVFSLHVY